MNQKVALITDSSALLTDEQVAAIEALVVPVTVTVAGVDYLDGVDISPDEFFALVGSDPPPSLATAQPSPARFLRAFEQAQRQGATSVLAIVVGSAYSGTFDSAMLAASRSPVPVRCVDSGQASFGVGLCVLAAAESLRAGATAKEAADRTVGLAASIESVFIIQALELARASGRFGSEALSADLGSEPLSVNLGSEALSADLGSEALSGNGGDSPIPVLALAGGALSVVAEVTTLDEAVEVMAARVLESGRPLRVASGLADLATKPVTDGLERRLLASPEVVELLRYRVGPSVAANTGPGTAGAFWHPVQR